MNYSIFCAGLYITLFSLSFIWLRSMDTSEEAVPVELLLAFLISTGITIMYWSLAI
jgi:hypothetical protein